MSELIESGYIPSDDEPFMNDRQKDYFREKLIAWKSDILREARETLETLQQENENHPDLADRASSETEMVRSSMANVAALAHRVDGR